MFLHLGKDVVIPKKDIVAIIDMDTSTSSRHTRAFLSEAEKRGEVFVVTDELPRSAVVCAGRGSVEVYICQISSKTLLKRAQSGASVYDSLM